MLNRSRHIRVFLSSTFDGMQSEREYLRKVFLPRAQKLCDKYSVTFSMIDLRWGITSQEVADQLVLHRCLEEIDKCAQSPLFFVGMIGSRYGTSFSKQDLQSYLSSPNARFSKWLIERLSEEDLGVTELEILYAEDIASKNLEIAPLYFIRKDARPYASLRDSRIAHQLKKIDLLPSRICIDGYSNPAEIGEYLLTQLHQLLNKKYSDSLSLTVAQRATAAILNEIEISAIQTENYHRLKSLVESSLVGSSKVIAIQGDAGTGKTTLAAQLYSQYSRSEYDTALFIGNFENPICSTFKKLGVSSSCLTIPLKEQISLIRRKLTDWNGRLILIWDALESDNFTFDFSCPNHNVLLNLLIDVDLPKHVTLIVTYRNKVPFQPDLIISEMTRNDIVQLLGQVSERFGKTIPLEILTLLKTHQALRLPMTVSMIVTRLIHARSQAEVLNIESQLHELVSNLGEYSDIWTELVNNFLHSVFKEYNVFFNTLGSRAKLESKTELLMALLNDEKSNFGIEGSRLSELCNLPETVLIDVLERIKPILFVFEDRYRSRLEFHTGLNEGKSGQRSRLIDEYLAEGEKFAIPMIAKNISTYFNWTMGGRTHGNGWLIKYANVILSPVNLLILYRTNYRSFIETITLVRYLNPENYLKLYLNFKDLTKKSLQDFSDIANDPLFAIEFPLIGLVILQYKESATQCEFLYEYALSYQKFLESRPRRSIRHAHDYGYLNNQKEGASLENFMNFRGVGEQVYGTTLYKANLVEGYFRFSDFNSKVAQYIESNTEYDFEYGKLLASNDFDAEIQELESTAYQTIYGKKPRLTISDDYVRSNLRKILGH